jgi:hypothetical protein
MSLRRTELFSNTQFYTAKNCSLSNRFSATRIVHCDRPKDNTSIVMESDLGTGSDENCSMLTGQRKMVQYCKASAVNFHVPSNHDQ